MATMELNGLKAAYPDWHIRLTLAGVRIATRMDKCDLSAAELKAGLVMTLITDDWDAMHKELAKQAGIEPSQPRP